MSAAGVPVITLVREDHARWRIELRSLKTCQDALGPDALNTFCRCFIQAERLSTLADLRYLSQMQYKPSWRNFERHQETLTWCALGIARELAREIRNLRDALNKRSLLDLENAPWRLIRDIETRINTDPLFARINAAVKFNLDQEVVERGIAAIDTDVLLAEGGGGRRGESSLRLGLSVLFKAYGLTLADMDRFMNIVSDDHDVSTLLQQAFIAALGAVGLTVVEATDVPVT